MADKREDKPASVTEETKVIPDDKLPADMDERRRVVAEDNAKKGKS